ncbi:M14 family metallopeptidase [Shewanella salipaludis]|uniref:M14 family metallocarboxypeptidase n=1 Tax=Shewanella salipaludis TaxID=2723052 RepID=A0A972JLF2_9GAMM|nr:M14 family metallocarboxypeptidase [Shewanella salipaludis]NMH65377.1 M14 family metallocarboxypeptidase [Shewanella salipaludis]
MASRSPFESFQWTSNIFDCESTDIDSFYLQLAQETRRLGLTSKKLGEVGDYPIHLYQSPAPKAGLPSVLISAGFHGEEAAGPWGLVHFLSEAGSELFERVNLTLLPLVNPTGFKKGHRFNKFGENPNRGFVLENGKPKANSDTSVEGKMLLEHSQLLLAASRDGILTCHEDVLQQQTYVYSFEPSQVPGRFSLGLRDALTQYFPQAVDDAIDGCPVKDGVIFNHFDTSFEAFLVRSGAKLGACSETPGLQNFDQRILANSAVMTAFLNVCAPAGE